MIKIDLQPDIEAQLVAEAQARGETVDRYVTRIVENRPVEHFQPATVVAAIDRIRALRKGSFSRKLNFKDLIHEGHRY